MAYCRVCQAPIDPEALPTVDSDEAARGDLCPICRALDSAPSAPAPERRIGRFRILGVLGRGAVGVVYDVYDPERGERLALKTLGEDVGATSVQRQRFLREAHILVALQHPGIVGAVEVGADDDVAWIAMPRVEGEDLEAVVRRMGRVPWKVVARWGVELSQALHYAHRRRVVHRDVKPANLHLDSQGRIRILDFGLATALDASGIRLTGSHATLGTPFFMPPEQIGGARAVDARSDVYSLGATLYFALSGDVPFPGSRRLTEIFQRIVHEPPPSIGPGFPAALDEAIRRAMAKDPADRFASAKDLGAALLRVRGGTAHSP